MLQYGIFILNEIKFSPSVQAGSINANSCARRDVSGTVKLVSISSTLKRQKKKLP